VEREMIKDTKKEKEREREIIKDTKKGMEREKEIERIERTQIMKFI
jgi:hypothetical protein